MLLVDQLSHMAAHHPDEVAYSDLASGDANESDLTFAQWESGANRVARTLVERGIRPGDRVALYLESTHVLRWIQSYAAIHRCGAVAVPINTRLTAPELDSILNHATPVAVITSDLLTRVLSRTDAPSIRHRLLADTEWDSMRHLDAGPIQPPVTDDDLADIMDDDSYARLAKRLTEMQHTLAKDAAMVVGAA